MSFINKKTFISLFLLSTCMILSSCGPKPTDSFTITWKNDDGSVLKEDKVNSGVLPSYTGTTPSKGSTSQYEYTFSGWTPEVVVATKDATYTATYTSNIRSYDITWKNDDGSTLRTDSVEYGKTPDYGLKNPTKPSTDDYDYEFSHWEPEITDVTGPATYTAHYTSIKKYLIIWKNDDDSILKTEKVREGKKPDYGSVPIKGPDAQFFYTFSGWSPALVPVTGPATYKATYSTSLRSYKITWQNDDGTTLKTDTVPYGETPKYTGEKPKKPSTAKYEYEFSGWSPALVPVTGDTTYTATYTATILSYDVVFKNGDEVLQSEKLEYGTTPEYKGEIPTKDSPEYLYFFVGWDPELAPIEGDTTYNAQFSAHPKSFDVAVTSEDTTKGTVSGSGTFEYGSSVTVTATPATRYVLDGWYDGKVKVSTDYSYTFTMPARNVSYVAKFVFNENTWYLKSDWWNYCSNGKDGEQATASDIGKEVGLTVNGKVHRVRLIDIDHDYLVNVGKAHCTFEFIDLLSDSNGYSLATFWNTSDGKSSKSLDYLNSDLRKALDGSGNGTLRWYQKDIPTKSTAYTTSVYDMLPSGLKGQIKTVNKHVATGNEQSPGNVEYKVTNYDAKVFTLTYREFTESYEEYAEAEGNVYRFYKEHNVDLFRIKHQIQWHDGANIDPTKIVDESGGITWEAYNYAGFNNITDGNGGYYYIPSPSTKSSYYAWNVAGTGALGYYSVSHDALAVAPAFCI